MDLKSYLATLSRQEQTRFAKRCGTSIGHLRNIVCGLRQCGEGLAISIEKETTGAVPCESLRSDVDWAYLRGTAGKRIASRPAA